MSAYQLPQLPSGLLTGGSENYLATEMNPASLAAQTLVRATATQRAEAFLRTLNLWTD